MPRKTKQQLRDEQIQKFLKNILKHTAPLLAIFFLQLSQGVDYKLAGTVALYSFYALLGDYFKKMK